MHEANAITMATNGVSPLRRIRIGLKTVKRYRELTFHSGNSSVCPAWDKQVSTCMFYITITVCTTFQRCKTDHITAQPSLSNWGKTNNRCLMLNNLSSLPPVRIYNGIQAIFRVQPLAAFNIHVLNGCTCACMDSLVRYNCTESGCFTLLFMNCIRS